MFDPPIRTSAKNIQKIINNEEEPLITEIPLQGNVCNSHNNNEATDLDSGKARATYVRYHTVDR